MTSVGQCPSCHANHELSEKQLGRLFACDCGARLFACDAREVPTFPLFCDACNKRYELDGEDAGQVAECECGKPLTIPTIVLRQPVQYAKELEDFDSGNRSSEKAGHGASAKDIDSGTSQKPIGAPPLPTSAPNTAAIVVDSDQHDEPCDEPVKPTRRREIKTSWIAWSGTVATAAFLVFSIVIYFRRDPSVARTEKEKATESTDERGVGNEDAIHSETDSIDNNPAVATSAKSIPTVTADPIEPMTLDVGLTLRVGTAVPIRLAPQTTETETADYNVPPAPLYALPKPVEARPRIPLRVQTPKRMTLKKAVEEAFEAYETTQQLKETAETSKSTADVDKYHESLGKTVTQVAHVLEFAIRQADNEQVHSMRYLLAYLLYDAGHLMEACVMGEAVARWGEKDDPSTREGALIALAAAQEASETHWGKANDLAELDQMAVVADLFMDRWPDDPQVGDVLMNLAFRYEAFNRPEKAVLIYESVPETSPQFADARIASGLALWMIARRQAIASGGTFDPETRQRCERQLTQGLRALEKQKGKPSQQSIEVRLALAQIAMTAGKAKQAENWLVDPKHSVTNAIGTSDQDKKRGAIVVNEFTVRQVFDVLYAVRRKLGDQVAVKQTMDWMSQLIPASDQEMESKYLSTVKSVIDRLISSNRVASKQIEELRGLERSMMDLQSSVPTSNLLWLAESWSQIGDQTTNAEDARNCAARAAELYGEAMLRADFPAGSLQSAQLRTIELLRQSGAVEQALKMIEEVLARTPNVFGLQIAAAESLQQVGVESENEEFLKAAVEGPAGFSPIWGWSRLVTSLHAARWSDSGTEAHAEQLLRCRYGLVQCRYLLAEAAQDIATRKSLLSDLDRSLRNLLATMDPENPWHSKFKALQTAVKAGR